MVKKIISVATAFLMLCCMVPFYAFAESATCPKCGKDTLITNQDISVEIGEEVGLPLSLKRAYCSTCHYAKYEYNVLGVAGEQAYDDGDESHIINFLKSLKEQLLGKNSTATKFTPGGGSTSGGGVGRPKGYSDDNGTASIGQSGKLQMVLQPIGIFHLSSSRSPGFSKSVDLTKNFYSETSFSGTFNYSSVQAVYQFTAPCDGIYFTGSAFSEQILLTGSIFINNWIELNSILAKPSSGYGANITANKGDTIYYVSDYTHPYFKYNGSTRTWTGYAYRYNVYPLKIQVEPLTSTVVNQNSITINNNTWNGNIYTDNSTNLTYIYPQYTTVNEKNETVTNISNTPIIYNNETKQYYTYDQTTKNYYYITYNAQPTPSPSPTPAPTEKPGGSISTPETGKPGGDTGDTTGILAVLVEIRDNMIQGFLDIKAAFVAGFAELSANFTLAIENLNVNIQNVFNKKFPDQSTPETALPSPTPSPSPAPTDPPSPSPAPTDPPSPSPAPDPGKPDSGDKTNNFWTIIFPNGGGSEDGKKGIFWALVSLILALIAFFANLAVGVGYLFPFLPDGVVMTINTCLIVIFLFTIIKFIMRSK